MIHGILPVTASFIFRQKFANFTVTTYKQGIKPILDAEPNFNLMRMTTINPRKLAMYFSLGMFSLIFFSSASCLRAQSPRLFQDGDLYGYRSAQGQTIISVRYRLAEEFSKQGIAAVLDENGWAYINRRGNILLRPFIFDNGPDYFKEGLARMVENGKIGFFDRTGKIVIQPKFDFAYFFSDGLAAVCQGCRSEKADAEHSITVGGRWGYIDRTGKLVIPLKYGSAGDFSHGKAAVNLAGRNVEIDRQGRIVTGRSTKPSHR